MTDQENTISETATFVQHTKSKRTKSKRTKSKRQHLIGEIKELKQEAERALESYRQQIINRTDIILHHAEEYSSSEDEEEEDEEDDYSTINRARRDKKRMSDVVEMLYELQVPLHPYCDGCNREHGGPHPGQRQHMGVNGCLNTD